MWFTECIVKSCSLKFRLLTPLAVSSWSDGYIGANYRWKAFLKLESCKNRDCNPAGTLVIRLKTVLCLKGLTVNDQESRMKRLEESITKKKHGVRASVLRYEFVSSTPKMSSVAHCQDTTTAYKKWIKLVQETVI